MFLYISSWCCDQHKIDCFTYVTVYTFCSNYKAKWCLSWWWSWSSNALATWYEVLIHCKRPWCWERLKAGGEGNHRGWDGWIASPTQWTWVWESSGNWWWPGKPEMLQSMGSQRVGHNWTTELNWTKQKFIGDTKMIKKSKHTTKDSHDTKGKSKRRRKIQRGTTN